MASNKQEETLNTITPDQAMAQNTKGQVVEKVDLVKAVQDYLRTHKCKIVIGTPCYGGVLHSGYFNSMIDLSQ